LIKERPALTALAAVFFIYVFAIRTHDVASTFLMLGEQTRDWTVALGGITDLPLVGAPSTAGGRGFGPSYYWVLWLGRVVLGPFMDNLPHVGGITVALIQSIADTLLLIALSRRVHWSLALSMCLLIASAPFDIAISSVIWNPPVSEAFIKMAIAMALMLTPSSPLWQVGLAAAFAWLAVQAHLSGIFVAGPLLVAIALQSLTANKPKGLLLQRLLLIAATVLALQIPFFISMLKEPGAPVGPSSAIAGLTHPKVFKPLIAYNSVTGITGNLVWPLWNASEYAIPVLIGALIIAIAYRKDLVLIAITGGAFVMATVLFTTSTRSYDGYWFLTMTAALTLTLGMAVAAIPSKTAVKWIGIALLAFIVWRQPARIEDSTRFFKYPQYDAMLKGSRRVVDEAPVVKDIKVTFEVHPTMDRQFIYKILGGRIDPSALYTAVINSDGSIRLE
jgi:hypothetical protein